MKWFKKKQKITMNIPPNSIRYHLHFEGLVQQVGFRIEVFKLASQYNITGWIKNNYDGSVECELQGNKLDIEHLLNALKQIPRISILNMEKQVCSPIPEISFDIRG